MPELIVNCPQCERVLRVAENLLGRLVKCPVCGLIFSVPAGSHEPLPATPLPVGIDPAQPRQRSPGEEYAADDNYDERSQGDRLEPRPFSQEDRVRANSLITPPAVCLLITGILGVFANCVRAVIILVSEPQRPGPEVPAIIRDAMEMVTPQIVLISAVVFGSLSLLVAFGALQMLRRRMLGLAITSSILAMINLECFCCLLGLPFGIWSLVVLSKPEVRSVFQ
jgi:hypothetical protein